MGGPEEILVGGVGVGDVRRRGGKRRLNESVGVLIEGGVTMVLPRVALTECAGRSRSEAVQACLSMMVRETPPEKGTNRVHRDNRRRRGCAHGRRRYKGLPRRRIYGVGSLKKVESGVNVSMELRGGKGGMNQLEAAWARL